MVKDKAPPKLEDGAAVAPIDRISAETLAVPIRGTAPLLMHRFSEKAKLEMLHNAQSKKTPRQPKNPEAEYEAAFYRLKNGEPGFPALGFKQATIGGARFYGKQITMTALKQFIFFTGEPGEDGHPYVPIIGEPVMREDVVRVGRGGTDLRYRPQFNEWTTTLTVIYVTSMLTRGSLLSLIDAGGMGVGVGEWRPERDGDFGTYAIDETKDIEVISR
ncbi:MAG: hypothetical protein ACRDIC_01415 [bacterium]